MTKDLEKHYAPNQWGSATIAATGMRAHRSHDLPPHLSRVRNLR